jgi:hypothetical protein
MQYAKEKHPLEPHQIEAAILGIAKAIVANEPEGSCDTIASCDSKGCVEKRLLAVEQIRVYLVDDLIAIAADEIRQRNNA